MPAQINIEDIYFGERDALHEFMKQDRDGISVLDNSFVDPPKIKMRELYNGSRFFIVGPKGSGKTTLIWHLKRTSKSQRCKVILFKSNLRKEDRDKLDKMIDMIVVQDQNSYRLDSDYKTVWEWYIIRNILRLIEPSDILEGGEFYRDCALLMEADNHRFNTLYDKFHIDSIKGNVKINIDVGALKSELSAEISARRTAEGRMPLLDLVRLVQESFGKIVLSENFSLRIYFDELEFFVSKDGDGERDRRMIRDLLFAVYNVNQLFSEKRLDIVTFASVRSEVLRSIMTINQEVGKLTSAFGINLDWYNERSSNHPILHIFETKIKHSEVLVNGDYSDDVWLSYFPMRVRGKEIGRYLLDMGLHRPRGVLLRLSAAAELAFGKSRFAEEDFEQSEDTFGQLMLEEFAEEISASYDEGSRAVIFSLFEGRSPYFYKNELQKRIASLAETSKEMRRIRDEVGVDNLLRFLFRIGMIGNHFQLEKTSHIRQIWSFRGASDPALSQRFVLHQSIRKTLATI